MSPRILCMSLLVVLLPQNKATLAQTDDPPRLEIGPVISGTALRGLGIIVSDKLKLGVGGRIAGNVHSNIGIEFQMTSFPSTRERGSTLQGSGHLKLNYRGED